MVDLRDASAKFLKIGSTPSFVKRANNILKIEASNLPMGIIEDVEVDVVGEQLKTGDILIMMSDGIFEGAQHVENHELWMKRKIKELQTEDPQEIADIIMERGCDATLGALLGGYVTDLIVDEGTAEFLLACELPH
ncbi:hypothetical protein DD583_32910, partial [Klebsiella pneumoniae]